MKLKLKTNEDISNPEKGLRFHILPSCQINVHCAYDQIVTISTTKNLFNPNEADIQQKEEMSETDNQGWSNAEHILKFCKLNFHFLSNFIQRSRFPNHRKKNETTYFYDTCEGTCGSGNLAVEDTLEAKIEASTGSV